MLDKIRQAMEMWNKGETHGEILKRTGLSDSVEFAATEIAQRLNLSADDMYQKSALITCRMTSDQITSLFGRS